MKINRFQMGLSLIELLIAMLISAFLIAGILQIFIGSKQTYSMQQNLSRLQENGRFALEFLERDIRMAGYWGCLVQSAPNTTYDISGEDNVLDTLTDTLTLRGAYTEEITGSQVCGDRVDITATYYTGSSSKKTYKIIPCSVATDTTVGLTNDGTECLIEGIENMQILYGVDTDGDKTPNSYLSAPTIGVWGKSDWDKVVSINISLLAVTLENNLTSQPIPYTFNGNTYTPGSKDRKIRRVFTTTIALRNRLL